MLKRLIATAALLLSLSPAFAATCSVSEFRDVATLSGGQTMQIAKMTAPGPTTQTVTATSATAVTNAFAGGTRYLWVYCDEVMHMRLGTTPTTGLTTGNFRIPAGGFWIGLEPADVSPGTLKIALCDADCA